MPLAGAARSPATTPWSSRTSAALSVVIIRPTADVALQQLRHRDAFEAACRAIPALAAWTDPGRAVPTTDVLVGGRLRNVYREQQRLLGLVAVGDSVSTTTPTVGRGVAMASMQIGGLLDLLDGGADPVAVGEPFGEWCDEHIRPWVEDHIARDDESVQRLQGADIDLATADLDRDLDAAGRPADLRARRLLPRDEGAAATWLRRAAGPRRVRVRLAPAVRDGPSRDELVAVIESAMHPNGSPSWSAAPSPAPGQPTGARLSA